jgi:UDP-glucuronate 4-epimerase
LFNNGRLRRDFTYIDDVTEAIVRIIKCPHEPNPSWSGKAPDPATSRAPWRLYNVGNSHPVEVLELVRVIEQVIGRPAIREFLPMQPDDVLETCADSSDLEHAVGFRPNTSIERGTRLFVRMVPGLSSVINEVGLRSGGGHALLVLRAFFGKFLALGPSLVWTLS